MPSFRVSLAVGLLRPGVPAASILPAAKAAGADLTTVESSDVSVVGGAARITVRFTAEDTPTARTIADHVCATTGALASISDLALTRRYGGRWLPV
ncbi:hypothetical protein SAMN05216410_1304 [Sanguibacter gelidistatuariae]|uniref:Uncharacterized protein n=1 Tax=Sanguibacter gelidistatuariae TaxID=1814289 RepID=A0A1G6JCG2_9MICO|nr:hypothetical protein [Sanguibacter gelidistatuariae]SDC16333.1 hypothetical protein SAMN05216410_1304 [Sanguibacter gelidistatuariae]